MSRYNQNRQNNQNGQNNQVNSRLGQVFARQSSEERPERPVIPGKISKSKGPQKSERAVALKYNKDSDLAPVVIASGYGEVAERIIDIAENRGIPVYRDDSASSMLCMLDVGATIPDELYGVVAAIYAQILKTASNIKDIEE